jgi:polysaccharide chain length determinant protein (PEP-CTERM system associated)
MTIRTLTIEDAIAILRKRWPVFLLLAIVGAGIGWETARVLPKRYLSQTVVLVEQPQVPGDYVKPIVIETVNQRLASMQQEILSRSRLEPIIKKLGLYAEDVDRAPMDNLVARLQKTIDVTPIRPMAETQSEGLPGFTVGVTFGEPHMAQQIASEITSMFMEANSRARQQTVAETSDFLAAQLDQAKAKLNEQDAKLADFQRRYIGTLPDDEHTNLSVLTGLTSQLDATTQALSRAQQDKSFTESMLAQQVATWQEKQSGQNTDPDALELQLNALQGQLAVLRSKYTDDYPDVIKVKNDLINLQKRIADSSQQSQAEPAKPPAEPSQIQQSQAGPAQLPAKAPAEPSQIQALRTQIHQHDAEIKERTAQQDELQQQIKNYQARVQSSPAVEQEYKALTRDYQTALDFYNDLLRKRDQSAMATDLEKRQEGEQFQVLDAANLPTSPSFPNVPLFISGGAAGGLGLAMGLFLVIELIDNTLRNEKEVESLLHLPVLAMLPAIKAVSAKNAATSSFGVGVHS